MKASNLIEVTRLLGHLDEAKALHTKLGALGAKEHSAAANCEEVKMAFPGGLHAMFNTDDIQTLLLDTIQSKTVQLINLGVEVDT